MSLAESITEATKEIFSSMIMLEVTPGGEGVDSLPALEDNITGTIGLAGAHKASLAIHFPAEVAAKITASFLGMEVDEVGDDVDDAIGEIANMLGGSIKGFLSENSKDIKLSLPSIIRGSQYTFNVKGGGERLFLPFTCDAGSFYVDFLLENG